MLYIIGLGLNPEGISFEGLEILKRCKKVYLENYTVDFPYSTGELQHFIDKKIISLGRNEVENLEFLDEAQKLDVALLVYGNPLAATTHIVILNECKASGIKCKVIHATSIFDAIAETGLQLYKFGKTASMPKWIKEKNFTPDSFIDIVKENQSINAHTLMLIDIGMYFDEAVDELEKSAKNKEIKIEKIIVCKELGTKYSKIYYGTPKNLIFKKINVKSPFCIIIPSKLHFMEKESLQEFVVE